MFKAYKYRIYPNKEQEELIQKTFGCVRFVYNQCLAYKKDKYELEKVSMSKTDCNNYVNRVLKKEYEWLKEVDSISLQQTLKDLDQAYKNFFKRIKNGTRVGFPKFKSKKNNNKSYTTNNQNGTIYIENNKIKLPKLKKAVRYNLEDR